MFFRHNYLGLAWACLILVLSGMPGSQFRQESPLEGLDKYIHAFLFMVLVMLLIVGFTKQHRIRLLHNSPILYTLSFSFVYGIVIEVLQGTVFAGRSIEVMDILANSIGSALGVLSFLLIYKTGKNNLS